MKKIIFVILLALAGLGLYFYPQVANYFSTRNATLAVQEYTDFIESVDMDILEAELTKAQEYNKGLTGELVKDPFMPGSGIVLPKNYWELLHLTDTMGIVSIPKIDLELPFSHGTSPELLLRRVGHLEGSALPVGGLGTHAVLTGHTGLTNAKLFTDLRDLVIGDIFFIQVLHETLAYRVDQIKVVNPEVTEDLLPVPGQDLVTLITCTPYGINSHRLLVRGTRIEYNQEAVDAAQRAAENRGMSAEQRLLLIVTAITSAVMICIIFLVLFLRRRKQEKQEQELKNQPLAELTE